MSDIWAHTTLLKAFDDGFTPDDIKQGVIEIFSPYFRNHDLLTTLTVNVLMNDAIEFTRLSKNALGFELFEYSSQVHHKAISSDQEESLYAISNWLPTIYDGLSTFWSQLNLELDKENLEFDEFVHECLRNIGSIIEGSIKPLARELLHQGRIGIGKPTTEQDITQLDFGNVIDELIRSSPNPNLFTLYGVRLNQWRNIAQHFSINVETDNVICHYGRPGHEQHLSLTRNELFQATKQVVDFFAGLRLANRLFMLDNLQNLRDRGLFPKFLKIRSEMDILNLTASLASQGFEIVKLEYSDKEAYLAVKDVTELTAEKRRIHTIQFVNVLWYYTNALSITVEYIERDGTPNFRTFATKDLFERVEKGESASIIAEQAELTDLKTGLKIP